MNETSGEKLEGGLRVTKGVSYRKNVASDRRVPADTLVSVITIAFNGAAHIEHTIKSVLSQSHKNIEYIVVDGGSTDGTLDIIKKYEDKIDYWVSEKDRGISDAMNKGVALASGDIIGMIHADDWYEAGAVESAVNAIFKTGAGVVCADLRYYKDGVPYFIGKSAPGALYKTMSVWHPTVFVCADIYKSAGVFDLKYKSGMDYDLLLRFKMKGITIVKEDKIFANMRAGGISDQSWRRMLNEEYMIKKANGIGAFKAYVYYIRRYFCFAAAGIFKKVLTFLGLNGFLPLLKKIRNRFDKRFIDN